MGPRFRKDNSNNAVHCELETIFATKVQIQSYLILVFLKRYSQLDWGPKSYFDRLATLKCRTYELENQF